MTASYWVAKYTADLFRDEPKNVGVIVKKGDDCAAHFLGERLDRLALDGRRLGFVSNPDVYRQWVKYWQQQVAICDIDAIVKASTPHFYVRAAGEVVDTGNDSARDVCNFLFQLLVFPSGLCVCSQNGISSPAGTG